MSLRDHEDSFGRWVDQQRAYADGQITAAEASGVPAGYSSPQRVVGRHLTWSEEKPAAVGWWWLESCDLSKAIVRLDLRNINGTKRLVVAGIGDSFFWPDEMAATRWAGPLP